MQQTSLDAYHSLGDQKITERQQQVLIVLEEHFPACNREIGLWAGLPINSITPRVLELRKKGLVEAAFIGNDVMTNKRVIFWRPVKQKPPKSMRQVRRAKLEEVGSDN